MWRAWPSWQLSSCGPEPPRPALSTLWRCAYCSAEHAGVAAARAVVAARNHGPCCSSPCCSWACFLRHRPSPVALPVVSLLELSFRASFLSPIGRSHPAARQTQSLLQATRAPGISVVMSARLLKTRMSRRQRSQIEVGPSYGWQQQRLCYARLRAGGYPGTHCRSAAAHCTLVLLPCCFDVHERAR